MPHMKGSGAAWPTNTKPNKEKNNPGTNDNPLTRAVKKKVKETLSGDVARLVQSKKPKT